MSIPKQITFLDKNETLLVNTVNEFCGPIISTLGPGGCTVIIADDSSSLPHVTKDGVTVSESIFFADNRKQAIASLIKEAALKTANSVGDGTTTSVVLAQAMILGGIEKLKTVKSKKEFFEGFDLAFEKVIDLLTESNVPITKDSALLESVIKIATNNDEKICKHIMSAVKAAGPDGLVNVELHDELRTIVDIKGGSSLESNTLVLKDKRWDFSGDLELILVSGAITKTHEILNLVRTIYSAGKPTIIIAKEFSEEVISTFAGNQQRGTINVVLVESEGFARTARMEILEDLSAIFSVPIYSTDGTTTISLSEFVPCHCATLSRAIIKASETVLFRADETFTEAAETRYEALKRSYNELKASGDLFTAVDAGELKHLQRRMAKYNVVATIKIGASTKAEAEETKDRVDDALSAISAAINGGITQGGGIALLKAGTTLIESGLTEGFSTDKIKGFYFMTDCCHAPFLALSNNAGITISDIPVSEILGGSSVYDFRDFEVVDYLEAGIIDPVLVPIAALTNSSSVAKTILKSNSIISEWQEQEAE
jgi:chaperonin GroEL